MSEIPNEDIKGYCIETYQKILDSYVSQRENIVSEHMRAILEFSKIAINCSFLLNGGAAVAILYNSKADVISQNLGILLWLCAVGAILSALCAGVSYVAQRFYFHYDVEKNSEIIFMMIKKTFNTICDINEQFELKVKTPKWVDWISYLSCALFLASLGSFCCALYKILPSL